MKNVCLILVLAILFASCEKESESLQLPPAESMEMNFSAFVSEKSATMSEIDTKFNYNLSKINVGFWQLIISGTLAVPVASFKTALTKMPVKTGDKSWQWSYSVNGFASAYTARLTGEIVSDSVEWKMYVSKAGVGAFDELLWFSGKSAVNRSGGYWVLNHSQQYQEPLLRIDWKIENNKVADIKYTIVRELNDFRQPEVNKGAYIQYGLQNETYNAFYSIHVWGPVVQEFVDINIEWSTTTYEGRVKSPRDYNDTDWHCWDANGNDVVCN